MSDDIQTFFEGARLVSQKNFTTQTRYTHNTYIYIVTQKLEHISWQFWGSFFDKLLRNNMRNLHFFMTHLIPLMMISKFKEKILISEMNHSRVRIETNPF